MTNNSEKTLPDLSASSAAGARIHIMLAVMTTRETVHDNPWIAERWRVLGVVAGESFGTGRNKRLVRSTPESEEYLWTGLSLCLDASEVDSYYHNLIGSNPSVYIYGHRDNSGEIIPTQISIEYIEAMAHAEFGNEVFPVPMPPEAYRKIEEFVLEHFVPEEPRQHRKRGDDRGGRGVREPND